MYMKPHPDPHHAILNLEGGDEEVLHIRAFGKDLGIEIRIDEAKTGVVIISPKGMVGFPIPGRKLFEGIPSRLKQSKGSDVTIDETGVPIVPKVTR